MHWDPNLPIYQQLRDKTVAAILDGTLAEGEALPSVRQVAVDFKVNPLTVSKAYQSLVDDDLIEARRGVGMFVREVHRRACLKANVVIFLKPNGRAWQNAFSSWGFQSKNFLPNKTRQKTRTHDNRYPCPQPDAPLRQHKSR